MKLAVGIAISLIATGAVSQIAKLIPLPASLDNSSVEHHIRCGALGNSTIKHLERSKVELPAAELSELKEIAIGHILQASVLNSGQATDAQIDVRDLVLRFTEQYDQLLLDAIASFGNGPENDLVMNDYRSCENFQELTG